jgi:hypothetical protein
MDLKLRDCVLTGDERCAHRTPIFERDHDARKRTGDVHTVEMKTQCGEATMLGRVCVVVMIVGVMSFRSTLAAGDQPKGQTLGEK